MPKEPRRGVKRRRTRTQGPLAGRPEMKYWDAVKVSQSPSNAWALCTYNAGATTTVFSPAQGNTLNGRDGNRVVVKSIRFKGSLHTTLDADQSTCTTYYQPRIVIFIDRQPNGAVPTVTDVMEATATARPWDLPNLAFKSRFRILFDKTFDLSQGDVMDDTGANTAALGGRSIPIDLYKKLELPVEFNGTASPTTIAYLVKNAIHCMVCSGGTAPEDRVRFEGIFRCRFVG